MFEVAPKVLDQIEIRTVWWSLFEQFDEIILKLLAYSISSMLQIIILNLV